MNKSNDNKVTKTTTKKVKVVGKEQYINKSTGELEDFQVIRLEDRDFDFTKIWLTQVISSLDIIGNKKIKVAFWIMDHLDRENKLCYTQRLIVKETGFSLDTVHATFKALLDANFLRKRSSGVYIVNPDLLFRGTRNSRLNILLQYQELDETRQEIKHAQKEYIKHEQAQTDIYDFIDSDQKQQQVAEKSDLKLK